MSNKIISSVKQTMFKVSVPIMATYSEEEIDVYGIPLTHNLETDKTNITDVMNMTTVYLTINRLIDIYSNGYPIRLIELDKLPLFYNTLADYAYLIKNNVSTGINHKRLLDDRLDMINSFANEVYNNNKKYIDVSSIKEFEGFGIKGLNLMGYSNVNTLNSTPSVGGLSSGGGINYISTNIPEVNMDELKSKRYRRYGKG